MAERKKQGGSRDKNAAAQTTPARQSTFFISGEGIDREVITTDICRYLGNDALVKPGSHVDKGTGRSQEGFYITAYRPPTTAQLADLRADSQKWREERRNSARSQGGYNQSATRQEAMRSEKMDDQPRVGSGPYPPANYGQMPPPSIPPGPNRGDYGQEYRVAFPNNTPGMSQGAASSSYANPRPYAQSEGVNYTYTTAPSQPSYVMDSSRDRMETAPGGPPWGVQPNPGYSSSVMPPNVQGYPSRPGFNYPSGVSPTLPTAYSGRTDTSGSYDAFGPRDSGLQPPETQGEYYPNDEEMEYDETPAPAPTHTQPRRDRDRDSRERHDEPRRKHGHR